MIRAVNIMNVSITGCCCLLWSMLICCFPFGVDPVQTARADSRKLSFEMENSTIEDVLKKMNQETGIHFFITQNTGNQAADRSFSEQTVDQILEKLFHRKNHALVWQYEDKKLHAVDIWLFSDTGNNSISRKEKRNEQAMDDPKSTMSEKQYMTQLTALPPPAAKTRSGLAPPPTPPATMGDKSMDGTSTTMRKEPNKIDMVQSPQAGNRLRRPVLPPEVPSATDDQPEDDMKPIIIDETGQREMTTPPPEEKQYQRPAPPPAPPVFD
jgi:hypothetical protein